MAIINYLCSILPRTINFVAAFITLSEKKPKQPNPSDMYTHILAIKP